MRYEIFVGGSRAAETDHQDLAEILASNVPYSIRVEDTWTGRQVHFPPPVLAPVPTPAPAPTYPTTLSSVGVEAVKALVGLEKKIPAIRLVREMTGMTLGEAKGVVDKIHDDYRREMRDALAPDNW